MFAKSKAALLGVLFLAGVSAPAAAADLYEPPVVPAPAYQPVETGGWYIRGDVDYHWSKMRGANYITYGAPCGVGCTPGNDFDSTKLKGSWSLGLGAGYKINSYLRTDLTADYWFKSDFTGKSSSAGPCGGGAGPCSSVDKSSMSALLLLANAYVDLGTWHRVTPYLGAGIGGAHIKWDNFHGTDSSGGVSVEDGTSDWRFAYALMAGASYCLTHNLDLDIGYRFTHIQGGKIFKYTASSNVGPGFDKGMNVHEVRAGLRYNFGGSDRSGCGEQVAYMAPEPAPVYK
jgi:opacity protein-like surface antigen